jgi:hypothetical protein
MTILSKHIYELAAFVGLVAIFVTFSVLGGRFGRQAVEKWASTNGFHLISVRRRTFVPFLRPVNSRLFQFFRVRLRDASGADRKGWVRLESDCTVPQVLEVRWDD